MVEELGIYAEQTAKRAVYRAHDSQPWQDCEIVGRHADGLVLREVGKVYRGVWVAALDRVRIATGMILEIEDPGTYQRVA